MRILLLLMFGLLLLVAGCTTAKTEKPKIHCPACGTDLDAIIHQHF